jgi:hypothetical protein
MKNVFRLYPIWTIDKNKNQEMYPDDPYSYPDTPEVIEMQEKTNYKNGEISRKMFNISLNDNPLKELKEIHLNYKLDVKLVLDEKSDEWKCTNESFQKNVPIFTFECKEDKKFLEEFEKRLKMKLSSLLCDPYQKAHLTMNGETPH